MSTTAPGAGGDPKQQLPERALGYLAEHGVLSYHFGSKEDLFAAIAQEAESRPRRLLASSFGIEGLDLADLARRTWQQLRAPELASLMRLFFELYGQALQGGQLEFPLPAWSCNHGEFADQPESSGRHRLRRRDVHEHPGRDDRQRGPADHRP